MDEMTKAISTRQSQNRGSSMVKHGSVSTSEFDTWFLPIHAASSQREILSTDEYTAEMFNRVVVNLMRPFVYEQRTGPLSVLYYNSMPRG
jgi:hypothetical protein